MIGLKQNLLAMEPEVTIMLIIIAALCGIALLYGVFRKFSRVGWTGFQVLIVFALTLMIESLPLPDEGMAGFFAVAAVVVISTVVVLIVGGVVRAFMRSRRKRTPLALRILNRVFGGVTALLNVAVFMLVLGGGVLNLLYCCVPDIGLNELFANELWVNFGAPYAGDLFLTALFVVVLSGGYKLGLFRAVWALMMIVVTAGAFAGAVMTAFGVGFVRDLSLKIAGCFANLAAPVASLIGYGIMSLVCFIVYAAVIVLVCLFVNWLLKKLDRVKPLRAFDGALMAVLACAMLLVVVIGADFAVAEAASGSMGEAVTQFSEGLVRLCTSSPVAEVFYKCNPLSAMMG